jgi:hypothetical protein
LSPVLEGPSFWLSPTGGERTEVGGFWKLDSRFHGNDKYGCLIGWETFRLRTQGGSYFDIRILSSLFGFWYLELGIYQDGFLPAQERQWGNYSGWIPAGTLRLRS